MHIKILLDTNAPWYGTGYGTQAALFAPRFRDLGHQVVIAANCGLGGRLGEWEGIPVLPNGYASYANDVRQPHARSFFGDGPGLLLALYDAGYLHPESVRGLATAVWSPVHSRPMSARDRQWYAATGAQPVAMSRYGEAEMRRCGLQPCYVPHAVDTSVFRPLPEGRRTEIRDAHGIAADAFLIVMVAMNKGLVPPRKAWGEQFCAFARFRERHPDAVMLCHTLIDPPAGLDLQPLLADLGLGEHVLFTGQYEQITGLYTPRYVADIMAAADVLSNTSYGEGFGLAPLEAQACGTPVVAADNSAQTELCGAGWLAGCQPFWEPDDRAWWHVPLIPEITAAYEQAYEHARGQGMRERARDFAMAYDADTVLTQHWKPVLEMLEQYCGAAPVRSPARNHGAVPLRTWEDDGLTWIMRGRHTGDGLAVGHEDALAPVLGSMLPDGGVFADVGAHVGRWALRMARKASKVIAVEPNPDTVSMLRAHIELNGITNVDVAEAAAWDSRAVLTLDDPNHQVAGGSTRVLEGGDGTVPGVPLDELLAGEQRVDLVKLDVEGADLHALRGMRKTLRRCRPGLVVERHDIYGYYQLADLKALLRSLGYRFRDLSIPVARDIQCSYLICEPEDRDG